MNIYQVGTQVRITATFKDSNGTLIDPTTTSMKLRSPHGVQEFTGGQVIKDSTGVYHVDVIPDVKGDWYYQWVGSGYVNAANEYQFAVTDAL